MFDCLLKDLLQGKFICEISDASAFCYLQEYENSQKVEEFLNQLGYTLAKTPNALAFYAAYQHIDNQARNDIRRIFQQFKLELHPVVEWLNMMMRCQNRDATLSPGDTLSFSALLQAIESNQSEAESLQSFAKFKDFAASDDSVKSRLEKLLATLNKWGYLALANRDTLIYQVTGKLDYFYQALQFIQEHENISLEQPENELEQESLF